jgi:hypothetical protein
LDDILHSDLSKYVVLKKWFLYQIKFIMSQE